MRRTDMIQVSMNEKIGPENSEAMKEMMGINGTQWGVFEVSDGMEDKFKNDLVSIHDEKEDATEKADELNKTQGFAEYPDYDPDHVAADHNLYYRTGPIAVKSVYGNMELRIEYKDAVIKRTPIEAAKFECEMGGYRMKNALQAIGESRYADPLEVFPKPNKVRSKDKGLPLTEEQEMDLRKVGVEFGLGGEKRIESGADYEIKEGGLVWKVEAEALLGKNAKAALFAGLKRRELVESEIDYLRDRRKITDKEMPKNEYEMVIMVAQMQEGFEALKEPEVLPFGYDVHDNYRLVEEPTGQFVKIGKVGETDIIIARIDWVDRNDGSGEYDKPGNVELMGVVSDKLSAEGDEESSVGLATSSAYASRAIEVKLAGLVNGRNFSVGMYDRNDLAKVKGQPVAAPVDIKQIPGEFYTIQENLLKLQAELDKQ